MSERDEVPANRPAYTLFLVFYLYLPKNQNILPTLSGDSSDSYIYNFFYHAKLASFKGK